MLVKHRGAMPSIDPTAYVAPNATLVGAVRVGPHARVMYGAVLDAEGARIEVGTTAVVAEHAVLRATAVTHPPHPVVIGDHAFVGPHTTVLGAVVGRCCYLAAQATVLQGARLGPGACVAVGALVHAGTEVPDEFFVPPHTTAIGSPLRVLAPDQREEVREAISANGFTAKAFGVTTAWTERVSRYEQVARVRSAEFGEHAHDTVL
ncbi:acyltransferase [Amycolatopsis cynarae]|uniref:Acyltransferase n=1 Tax=Amycolatopsis cynarae TaxID=2995223 RepID=A0ABY7B525_9PSEU|nr:acyltransferase [Amycolatopsis sp. HUAS 11-8]WAL67429.1 acyltransferase [Amycolatopsis sp. HUAS 11-8]